MKWNAETHCIIKPYQLFLVSPQGTHIMILMLKEMLLRPCLLLELWVFVLYMGLYTRIKIFWDLVLKMLILCVLFLQNYDTTESKLRREFEVYGPIKRVSCVEYVHFSTFLFFLTPQAHPLMFLPLIRSTLCTTRKLENQEAMRSLNMNTRETCTVSNQDISFFFKLLKWLGNTTPYFTAM